MLSVSDENEPLLAQFYKDLMKDYQPDVIPIYKRNQHLNVSFGLTLQQIQNVVGRLILVSEITREKEDQINTEHFPYFLPLGICFGLAPEQTPQLLSKVVSQRLV